MKRSGLGCYALCTGVAAMLAGCGALRQAQDDMQPPIGASGAMPQSSTPSGVTYNLIYSFFKRHGSSPHAGLINVNGTLYGTTYWGGANNRGTVFAITTSGVETVLHSFTGGHGDGEKPIAGLLNVNGTLYGTTLKGGARGCGTVFAITTSGTETKLYTFACAGDAAYPYAGLINVGGKLYGTTYGGGIVNHGTVFSITPSGREKVLYNFKGGSSDGGYPAAGLLNINGTLYGTTTHDGAYEAGTAFAITTLGAETTLHNFGAYGDGGSPDADLVNAKGALYGTTFDGGANNSEGTVFSITPSGTETVLHSFGGSGDGEYPVAGLINVKGTLYGTTAYGGGISCSTGDGCGTVYSITPSGTETVLHSFGGSGDGVFPYAGLINVKGTLYGTTFQGGANKSEGTVFSLTP